ncbi:hypothetical protein PTTG_25212 [Puccinia triticina 1-1 BBBD Race 1]|uniref:Uncharacterized protein n=2 Tax=Puccinia triticina TaxID=208348 RepID=A0A180H4Z3_PUCT1|nr:hypothetical protein PTTG_25212 [Puccinia triticina 1-1 BBBD Race 1]
MDKALPEPKASPELNELIWDVMNEMAQLATRQENIVYERAKIAAYAKALTNIAYSGTTHDEVQKKFMDDILEDISYAWGISFWARDKFDPYAKEFINNLPYVWDPTGRLKKNFKHIVDQYSL